MYLLNTPQHVYNFCRNIFLPSLPREYQHTVQLCVAHDFIAYKTQPLFTYTALIVWCLYWNQAVFYVRYETEL